MEVMKQEKMFEHENHYMYKMLLNSVITNLGGVDFMHYMQMVKKRHFLL